MYGVHSHISTGNVKLHDSMKNSMKSTGESMIRSNSRMESMYSSMLPDIIVSKSCRPQPLTKYTISAGKILDYSINLDASSSDCAARS